ncbi:alpha/beta hydrolase [Yinghuangia soli]|uniref:Alpha/beta hydrolase n=1 Tax=Yinghuangia soli TaxID=2908204 RepID=A0AA41Q373_9ACTN|nr:alpha/beta hydrolase [Yinghuangia soli]MCF2530723.1 alpha/beta hydrolase [Yinghuangia soli]
MNPSRSAAHRPSPTPPIPQLRPLQPPQPQAPAAAPRGRTARRRHGIPALLAPAIALAVLAAGCTSDDGPDTAKGGNTSAAPGTSGAPGTPPGNGTGTGTGNPPPAGTAYGQDNPALKDFYAQKLQWQPCPSSGSAAPVLQCAALQVPLDYAAPTGKTIRLAVYRAPATGAPSARIGSLAVNPGGPGSGVGGLVERIAGNQPKLAERYDIVGFDPRGSGRSSRIVCADGPLMDRLQSIDPTPADAAEVASAAGVLKEFGQGCASRMGDLLPHIGTATAIDDMDVFRAALGEDKLNYLGMSYGTRLGSHYAERHPSHVGRFVLDGLVDSSVDRITMAREQAEAFDLAFRAFAADCLQLADCPFTGTVADATVRMRRALDELDRNPAKIGVRRLDEGMAASVIGSYLYSRSAWEPLRILIGSLFTGSPRPLLDAFDSYADRGRDGAYRDSTLPGYFEISCADGQTLTAAEAADLTRDIMATAPVLGPGVVWSWAADCPAPGPDRARPIAGADLPGMLLISTTRDPATPHVNAPRVAAQLPKSVLVTYDGDGHVAFGGPACVDGAVVTFLTTGKLPAAPLTCS